jgi:hypothetical protein
MLKATAALLACAAATAHDMGLPVNPALGVPGYPSCVRAHPGVAMSVADAADDLVCSQVAAFAGSIKIGTIGDSITAGAHASNASHAYPQQLQAMLDATHGEGVYEVTRDCSVVDAARSLPSGRAFT